MSRMIRQVFGTTRPRDIWSTLLTFDQLVTRPMVHIVYWAGLGLLVIFGCGWIGVMIGSGMKDATLMGWLLSFGVGVAGLLGVLIAMLAWRSACEFYMAVMSIAEDLRHLRQYQEKLVPSEPAPPPQPVAPAPAHEPAAYETQQVAEPPRTDEAGNILEDPFFRPRFETRD
jgi:hypothetical protein